MLIFAIDPGPREHGWCLVEILPGERPSWHSAGKAIDVTPMFAAPDLAAVLVERPSGYVHEHARGAALLDTAYQAGLLVGLASAASEGRHTVQDMPPEQWRVAVTGLRSPSDAQVKAALGRLLDLPARSNAHERDACGLAVGWALRTGALVGGRGRRTPRPTPAE